MAEFQTQQVYHWASTAGAVSVDFEAAGNLGPADAVVVNVIGADRNVTIEPQAGTPAVFTVADGRSPVFDARTTEVSVAAGTAAVIEVVALYRDRWQ